MLLTMPSPSFCIWSKFQLKWKKWPLDYSVHLRSCWISLKPMHLGSTRSLFMDIVNGICKWSSILHISLLVYMLHYPIEFYLPNRSSKIKILEILRQEYQSIKPSVRPFWAQGLVWQHRSHIKAVSLAPTPQAQASLYYQGTEKEL